MIIIIVCNISIFVIFSSLVNPMIAVINFLMRDMSIVKSTITYARRYRFSTHSLIVRFILSIYHWNQSIDILQIHYCVLFYFILWYPYKMIWQEKDQWNNNDRRRFLNCGLLSIIENYHNWMHWPKITRK